MIIGGGKGGARGLKPPLGWSRGGLAPPQNQNSEMILLGVGLKIDRMIKYWYANRN